MLGSRHYRFLSQSTDEETEALNAQYLICIPTANKICNNSSLEMVPQWYPPAIYTTMWTYQLETRLLP